MRKNWLNLLMVAVLATFFVACAGDSTADTKKEDTKEVKKEAKEVKPDVKPPAANANANAEAEDDKPKTTIEFTESTHDFGEIDEGAKVSHTFKFKNTGSEPLIINSAKGSCGCTVPKWPKEPIAPGEGGDIQVEFNSKGKLNKQTKTVTINANTDPNPTRLTIKATVNKVEGSETSATPAVKPITAPTAAKPSAAKKSN